ncbi:hypothetical protein LSAT2_017820, partial [Lamellibrachia satsuma]
RWWTFPLLPTPHLTCQQTASVVDLPTAANTTPDLVSRQPRWQPQWWTFPLLPTPHLTCQQTASVVDLPTAANTTPDLSADSLGGGPSHCCQHHALLVNR